MQVLNWVHISLLGKHHVEFNELPDYMKPKIQALNLWPLPEPHPDAVIISFLRQFDVEVAPSELPGFDGMDLIIGFATNFETAQLNSINRNQQKQVKHQEWTTWKQWALGHAEYAQFKMIFLEAIRTENAHRLDWLNSVEGQSAISRFKQEYDKAVGRLVKLMAIALGLTASCFGALVLFSGFTTLFSTLSSGLSEVVRGDDRSLEPAGQNKERYSWLARKCIDVQKERYLQGPLETGVRDFCKERDVLIDYLVK